MNDEELANLWTTLQPIASERGRIDRRVFAWLEARDMPLSAEWIALFKAGPFSAAGLVTVSVVAVAVPMPIVWLAGLFA
jgi:hypothetical protein